MHNQKKSPWKKALKIATNKFLLTGIAFLAWMIYFDQNDYFSQQNRRKDLQDVKNNIAYLNAEIANMEKEHEAMVSDPYKLEKYARENYRMKRDNEDVYIIKK